MCEGFWPLSAVRVLSVLTESFYEVLGTPRNKAIFLMYASSGLRATELVQLTMADIDEEERMLIPDKESESKQTWVLFYIKALPSTSEPRMG